MNGKLWWLAVLSKKTIPHHLKRLDDIIVRSATTHFGFQEVDEKEKSRKGIITFYSVKGLFYHLISSFQEEINFLTERYVD